MFDVRGGFQPSSVRNIAGELTAVLDRSNTLGPEGDAERMFIYLEKEVLAVRTEVLGGARPLATGSIPPNGLSCRPQAPVTEGFAEHPYRG